MEITKNQTEALARKILATTKKVEKAEITYSPKVMELAKKDFDLLSDVSETWLDNHLMNSKHSTLPYLLEMHYHDLKRLISFSISSKFLHFGVAKVISSHHK
jgi:hypothetical protein